MKPGSYTRNVASTLSFPRGKRRSRFRWPIIRALGASCTCSWRTPHIRPRSAHLDRLHNGEPEASAWDGTLGDLDDPSRLEADYKASLAPVEVTTLRTSYAPRPSAAESVRAMDDTEVHLLWARLRDWESPGARAIAEADLAEAQRDLQNPDVAMVEALWEAHAGRREAAERVLQDALSAHPDDARLWSALGWLTFERTSRPNAPSSEAALALAPIATKLAPIAKSAAEFDLLARASLLDQKPDAAIAYEKSAIAADPNCIECLGGAAMAMLAKGMGKEALEVATLAQGLSPEGEPPRWLAPLVQRAKTASPAHTPGPAPADATKVVLFKCFVEEDGTLSECHLLKGEDPEGRILEAMKTTRQKPVLRDGKPQRVEKIIPVKVAAQ